MAGTRSLIGLLLGFLVAYTAFRFSYMQIQPPGLLPNDYAVFHRISERYLNNVEIYQIDDSSPFKYSPTFLIAFSALLHPLGETAGWYVWSLLSILGFAATTAWLWVSSGCFSGVSRRQAGAILGAFLICSWHGYLEHFSYGQGDMLLVFAPFVGAVAMRGERRAALIMALMLTAKPQSAILLAYFLVARRWRILAYAALFGAFLLATPLAVIDADRYQVLLEGWFKVLRAQNVEFMTGNLNQSVAASLARLTGTRASIQLYTLVIVAGAAGSALLASLWSKAAVLRLLPDRARLAALTLTFYAVATPLSWRWLTFYWLPVGVLLASDALRARDRVALSLLGAFVLNGLFLQKVVAQALGIHEIDELSWAGLYTLGNILLFSTALRLCLKPKAAALSAC